MAFSDDILFEVKPHSVTLFLSDMQYFFIARIVFDKLYSQSLDENTNLTDKWFMEIDKDYDDFATSFKIERVCHHSISKYQDVLVIYKYFI